MRQLNVNIIQSQAVTSVSVISSAAIDAENLFQVSAQIATTGGASAGTLKMQASNDDPTAGGAAPTNWNDVSGASVVVNAAGAFLIPKTEICYQYIRFVYTATGGGTISVRVKGLGA